MSRQGNPVDINELIKDQNLKVEVTTVDSEQEIAHRHEREIATDQHERKVFWVVFALLVVTIAVSFSIVMGLVETDEDGNTVEWARTIGSAIVAGLVGYVLPRRSLR